MLNLPMDILFIFSLLLSSLSIFSKKRERMIGGLTLLGFSLSFLSLLHYYLNYEIPLIIEITSLGNLSSFFRIDNFSCFLSFLSLFICILITFFSLHFPGRKKASFFILLLLCEFGLLGVLFSFDFFTLFVFWEIMAITSYFLITFGKGENELVALKYVIISAVGSATFLFSLALLFGRVGSLNFHNVLEFVESEDSMFLKFLFVLMIVCFLIKVGIVPFHSWVPDTYQKAYTPTTVLFSSILSKLGLFVILRILFIFYPIIQFSQLALTLLAIPTMFLGNILALFEQDLKRLLAFSSIAHMGYILFAFSIFTQDSLTAALFHMFNHSIVKSLMFFVAGICLYSTGKSKLKELRGIGKRNEILAGAIIIGSFSLIGMPPFAIFVSELFIILSAIEVNELFLASLVIFNILLSMVYYIRILRELALKRGTGKKKIKLPLTMELPILILSIACLLVGIYPWPVLSFLEKVVEFLFKLF